ncbi:hypothetical protein [Pseudoalteromonas sp. SR45-4]|nr:hypothetical protein [Pseudoalteromonas sp. SR45-4]MBB1371380.1 hypothetical protein [Pseudoalteromonas sp. SR45-4]
MDAATDRKVDFDSAITAAYAYKSDYAELSEWGVTPEELDDIAKEQSIL